MVDDAKKAIGSGVVAIASASPDGKAGIVVGVTDDLTERYSAVDFVRVASVKLGGKGGGGRPDLAHPSRTRTRYASRRSPPSRMRCAEKQRRHERAGPAARSGFVAAARPRRP
jgi:hypothetical protein